jgi:hypothetical protein
MVPNADTPGAAVAAFAEECVRLARAGDTEPLLEAIAAMRHQTLAYRKAFAAAVADAVVESIDAQETRH